MNKGKIQHITGLLKTWESGYISPSAAIAMKDARELIEIMKEEIESLDEIVSGQKKIIDQLGDKLKKVNKKPSKEKKKDDK